METRKLDNDKVGFGTRSYPTYEEWKPDCQICISREYKFLSYL